MDKLARITGGVALVAAPITLVASELLYGSQPEDPVKGLAALEAQTASWRAANLLGLLAATLFIPAIVTLASLPGSGRGRRWSAVGAVLGALGVVGYAAHTGAFVVIGQMAEQTADRQAMADLLGAADANPTMAVVFALFLLGLYLGLVLLVVGAWRARRVPLWSMVAVLGAVVLASVPVVAGQEYVAELLVILGLGGAGLSVLRGQRGTVSRHSRWPNGSSPSNASASITTS
jgi:hypothetical protein